MRIVENLFSIFKSILSGVISRMGGTNVSVTDECLLPSKVLHITTNFSFAYCSS